MLDIQRQDRDLALIRLDHGPVNALDLELLEALTGAISRLDADPSVRAIVLTGNDRAFCAGVDLKRLLDRDRAYTEQFLDALSAAFLAPLFSSTPLVAAVGGHAIAGGAVLAAACDRAIGAQDDRVLVGLPEVAVGVPLPTAAVEIMRRRLGTRLQEAVFTAQTYPIQQAHDIGFIDALVPAERLLDEACDIAAALGRVPSRTMALTKECLRGRIEAALGAEGEERDAHIREAWCSDDVRSAIGDFVDRNFGKSAD